MIVSLVLGLVPLVLGLVALFPPAPDLLPAADVKPHGGLKRQSQIQVEGLRGVKPNIVLLLTDDQDLQFNSIEAMPFTSSFIGSEGAVFDNFFAHTPVCCPSRAQLLSGRYMHNLKAANASVHTCMRADVAGRPRFHQEAFAAGLQQAGYATLMAGKFLNGKAVSNCPTPGSSTVVPPPAGWDRFFVMCPDTCYVNCLFGDDGTAKWFNDSSYPEGSNYAPSLIGNVTVDFIRRELSSASPRPFFAYIAPHSPHSPATPAPWYANVFSDKQAPRTASYNVSVDDHHWMVSHQQYIAFTDEQALDEMARKRLRTLLSVDDIIKGVVTVLEAHDALKNTVFVYTSDHGYHMGQFCLGANKRQPYDTDVRVPMMFRGPGVKPGQRVQALTGMPDLAPTLLELAGANVPQGAVMDGKSFLPMLQTHQVGAGSSDIIPGWREEYPIEYIATQEEVEYDGFGHINDNGNNTFRGLRIVNDTHDWAYFEFSDPYRDWDFDTPYFYELYDVGQDPAQLHNLYNLVGDVVREQLHAKVKAWYGCAGAGCG